eukprot:403359833
MLQPQEQENFEKWLEENKLERGEVLELFQTMSEQVQDRDHNQQRLEINQIDVQLNSQDSAFIDEGNQQPNEEEKDQGGYFKPFLSNVYNYAGNLYQRFRQRNQQEVMQNQQNNNFNNNIHNNQFNFERDRLELDQNNEDQNQNEAINFWQAFYRYGKYMLSQKPQQQQQIIEPVQPIQPTIELSNEEEQNKYEQLYRSMYKNRTKQPYPENKKIDPERILRMKLAMDIYEKNHKNDKKTINLTTKIFREKDQSIFGKILVVSYINCITLKLQAPFTIMFDAVSQGISDNYKYSEISSIMNAIEIRDYEYWEEVERQREILRKIEEYERFDKIQQAKAQIKQEGPDLVKIEISCPKCKEILEEEINTKKSCFCILKIQMRFYCKKCNINYSEKDFQIPKE